MASFRGSSSNCGEFSGNVLFPWSGLFAVCVEDGQMGRWASLGLFCPLNGKQGNADESTLSSGRILVPRPQAILHNQIWRLRRENDRIQNIKPLILFGWPPTRTLKCNAARELRAEPEIRPFISIPINPFLNILWTCRFLYYGQFNITVKTL